MMLNRDRIRGRGKRSISKGMVLMLGNMQQAVSGITNKEQQSAKDSMRSREIDWNCGISQATKTGTKEQDKPVEAKLSLVKLLS
jgi:hypothetical protein